MLNKQKITIGNWETVSILITAICTKIFINSPRLMAEIGGSGGWVLMLYISILAILFFIIISKLYRDFEGMDIVDLGEYVAGNTGRIITGLLVIIYLFSIICMVMREFSEDVKIISLQSSPISFVIVFFLLGIVAGAYFGIESIARIHALVVPVIIIGFIFVILGAAEYYDLSKITPVLGTGAADIFGRGFLKVSQFAELFLLFLLFPFIKKFNNFKKNGFKALIISSVFLVSSSLAYLLVFAYPNATESFLPFYQLARLINYGKFLQRGESLFMLIWGFAALLYLSTGFFFMVYIFKKTFKLAYYKPLILSLAILIFTCSLLTPNLISTINFESTYIRSFAGFLTFGFTIILLISARLKKKFKIKRRSKK